MSDVQQPLVWVVIPTWNRKADLLECLSSLAKSSYDAVKVLVVDNASGDGTVGAVNSEFPSVHVLALSRNCGATGASNRGFLYALDREADFVFRLDSDAIVHTDTLSHLVRAAQALPRAGVLVPKIYFADRPNVIWFAGAKANRWHFGATDTRRGQLDSETNAEIQSIDYAWSTGVLIRRDVLLAVDGFDEDFLVYFEEVDFCIRVRGKGFSLYLVPDALLWHKVGSEANSDWTAYQWNRSKMLLYRKHGKGIHRLGLILYAVAYALFRSVWPRSGRGNRGPLSQALRGLVAGLGYPVGKSE